MKIAGGRDVCKMTTLAWNEDQQPSYLDPRTGWAMHVQPIITSNNFCYFCIICLLFQCHSPLPDVMDAIRFSYMHDFVVKINPRAHFLYAYNTFGAPCHHFCEYLACLPTKSTTWLLTEQTCMGVLHTHTHTHTVVYSLAQTHVLI